MNPSPQPAAKSEKSEHYMQAYIDNKEERDPIFYQKMAAAKARDQAATLSKPTIVVSSQDPCQHPHLPPVQVPPKPEHPAWVSDLASLKKIYDKVHAMRAKAKKPKAKRIAYEQDIIPFDNFGQFEMILCAMPTNGQHSPEREWVYYMGGRMPGLDFVIRIYPDTSVYTGVPWSVYRAGSRLLEPEEMPAAVGEKRAREK